MRSAGFVLALFLISCGSGGDDAPGASSPGGAGSGGASGSSAAGGSAGSTAGAGGSAGSGGSSGSAGSGGLPSTGPNIVVFLVDDLDVESFQQLLLADLLPNIEQRIVTPGTTFHESFVSNSLCCPSRATFLSGQYSHNHGVISNANGHGLFLPHDKNTIATRLHDSGYRTAHVGKYLNGYDDDQYVAPGWDEWHITLDPSTYWMHDFELVVSTDGAAPAVTKPPGYQTDELSKIALSVIARAPADRPLFLVVTPLAPHVEALPGQDFSTFDGMFRLRVRPASRHLGSLRKPDGGGGFIEDRPRGPELALPGEGKPSFNEADISDKPSWMQNGPNGSEGPWPLLDAADLAALRTQHLDRLESMLAVDELVGQVLDALAARTSDEKLLVVFTSDNGFFLGEHRLNNKMFPYEEGIRVPLVVRAPLGAATRSDQLVLNNDLAPTLCDYAGVLDGWDVDGRSLRSLFAAPAPTWRRQILFEHFYNRVGARLQYNDLPDYIAVRTAASVATFPHHKLVRYVKNGSQLELEHYDLAADPFELESVHAVPAYQSARAALGAVLDGLSTCKGDACRADEE